jgi:hypothetical protein
MASVLEIIRADGSSIIFDASLREGHEGETDVTVHPVELGADVADHARTKPRKFSVDAFVTNTPIDVPETNMDGVTGSVSGVDLDLPVPPFSFPIGVPGLGAVAKVAGLTGSKPQARANALNFSGPFDRIGSVLRDLWDIQESAEEISVVTGIRRYDHMLIARISAPRTAETSGGMTFTIDFAEIRKVATKTVAVPKDKSAKSAKSKGSQPATEETAKDHTSVARKALEAAGYHF